jgi:D-tyrosyl-tRNA(Tyr) deacylase
MRIVLQRVTEASVSVDRKPVGKIGKGLVLLVGIGPGDSEEQARILAEKCAVLRIFDDDQGKMNLSLLDIGGEILAVSQFTLYGDTRKGRRPSFTGAASPQIAEPLFNRFVAMLRDMEITAVTGIFGARMQVHIVNDGPVTFILET